MTATDAKGVARAPGLAVAGLVLGGLLVLVAGGLWWAFDADPDRGRLVTGSGVACLLGTWVAHRRRWLRPTAVVAALGVLSCLVGGHEIWQAIDTINYQRTPRF